MRYFLISLFIHCAIVAAILFFPRDMKERLFEWPRQDRVVVRILPTPKSSDRSFQTPFPKEMSVNKRSPTSPKSSATKGIVIDPKKLLQEFVGKELAEAEASQIGPVGTEHQFLVHSESNLLRLAEELNAYLKIPVYLKNNTRYMHGVATIKKDGEGRYRLSRCIGTPYARAILYEGLREFLVSRVNTKILETTQLKEFKIVLLFESLAAESQARQGPYEATVNIVTIYRYSINQDPGLWKYLAAHQEKHKERPTMGLNVFAPILDLANFFFESEPEKVPYEVWELKKSRAFARAIR